MKISNKNMDEIRTLWRLNREPELIRHNQNAVYSTATSYGEVILRLTDTRHRSHQMLSAELEWIAFLVDRGIDACRPILSEDANFVEAISLGKDGDIHAVVFHKAKGKPISGLEEIDESLAFRWGATLGKIHAVSEAFEPSAGRRPDSGEVGIQSLSRHAVRLDHPPRQILDLVDWTQSLSKDPSAYGLIHSDFQPDNFFYDADGIYPFDFDDCCYHWRVADLAYPLYSIYFDVSTGDGDFQHYEVIREHLVDGFVSEYPAIGPWLGDIDRFIRYRIALLYCWCRNTEQVPHWMAGINDDWRQHLLRWSQEQIDTWG